MSAAFFVTGTDTEVGKTYVTRLLLREFREHGLHVTAYKPVAAGAERVGGAWRNEDGESLMLESSGEPPYARVNPVCLPLPLSPHLAARSAGRRIDVAALVEHGARLRAESDLVLAEGAGGWRVPLTETEDIADLARRLDWPVIVVVGVRLGCINHARLTLDAVHDDGLKIAGWIANELIDDRNYAEEITASVRDRVRPPLLGVVARGAAAIDWSEAGAGWCEKICK